MPGSARSRSTSASGAAPGASSGASASHSRASDWIAPARLRMMPSSAILSIVTRGEVGRRRESAADVGPWRRDVGCRSARRGGAPACALPRRSLAGRAPRAPRARTASTLPGRRSPGAPGRPASVSAIVSGAASRSSQRRTAAITAPLAGPSAGANESWTRGASLAKRASSQPAAAPTTPARTVRRIERAAATSTPAIARCGDEREQAVDVERRSIAERHRDRFGRSLEATAASPRRGRRGVGARRRARRSRVGFIR